MSSAPKYALSLKQPWAALLAHGRKTIEIRSWPTRPRGTIFIHAARIPDERAEAWALVPDELQEAARLNGGLVGSANLIRCITYRSVQAFTADQARHLNPPAWFQGKRLYGFIFSNATPLPFRPYSGWMRFFPVHDNPEQGRGAP
jgi:hypothetical protein